MSWSAVEESPPPKPARVPIIGKEVITTTAAASASHGSILVEFSC